MEIHPLLEDTYAAEEIHHLQVQCDRVRRHSENKKNARE